jgi:2-phospho-L-lactate/phosphoenolpyruvate guanylyltransferase
VKSDSVPGRWVVLLAVKPLPLAKSRLDRPDRSALTLAFAADTAATARSVESVEAVLVVTDDDDARQLLSPDAVVITDEPGAGLNAALSHGAAEAAKRWPGTGVVVVAADLPALRPAGLAAALALAGHHRRAVVADAVGTGTVLLSADAGTPLLPAFGPGSRARHIAGGAVDLTDALLPGSETDGLRHDVDTAADLDVAIRIGVGAVTTQALKVNEQLTNKWHTSRVGEFGSVTPGVRPRP